MTTAYKGGPEPSAQRDSSRLLQVYVWHAEKRFLFIASGERTYDFVTEQAPSEETLQVVRDRYRQLYRMARDSREAMRGTFASTEVPRISTAAELGDFFARMLLPGEIHDLLASDRFSELVVSTNEYAIPWELLVCDGTFLALKYALTRRVHSAKRYDPSGRVLCLDKVRVLLVHNPLGDLPGADAEARVIADLLRGREQFIVDELQGSECDRVRLMPLLARADLFHYAGHAFFNPERPKESGLHLSDGRLFATEIERYLHRRGPAVVFLNACDTAVFGDPDTVIAGQNIAGLAHGFITAGCGAVLAASLPVGDQQAANFASVFYSDLMRGESLAASALAARRAVAETYGLDDCTWSSFLLFGDGALRLVVTSPRSLSASDLVARAGNSISRVLHWFKKQRNESGQWSDQVYREEGAMNVAEVALAFMVADVSPDAEEVDAIIARLQMASPDYTAFPYPPHRFGVFTSCITYVIRAASRLIASRNWPNRDSMLREVVESAIGPLLGLQNPDGGWIWGERGRSVGPYTLFTVEALDAIDDWLSCCASLLWAIDDGIPVARDRGYAYLQREQRSDGGWSYRQATAVSDPVNTIYVICKLIEHGAVISNRAVQLGLEYLHNTLDLVDPRNEQFYIDHRIEVPDLPQTEWPHHEDYGGLGGLCNLLASLPEAELKLNSSGLFELVLARILDQQDSEQGWPRSYSTIYLSAYYVQVLAQAIVRLQGGGNARPRA